jgi:IS605 OrfB family transposase
MNQTPGVRASGPQFIPVALMLAIFGIEMDTEPPAKQPLEDIDPEEMVGIDVGILKYAHDTDGTAFESLNLSEERDRLEREQRTLSRKEHESNNWEKQRRRVAECHLRIKRERRDFLHKLSNYYAREYELVAVEDLNVKGMLESPRNSRNTASAAWNSFASMLEYNCEREGTQLIELEPEGTTKECAKCGVETDKPLWVREHSCPACGFEADRDANAVVRLRLTGSQTSSISGVRTNRCAIRQRLWRLRSPRELRLFLQSASWKQEAPFSRSRRRRRVGRGSSQPAIGKFVLMVVHEFEQWCDLIPVRPLTDFIRVPIPHDVALVCKKRQMLMDEFGLEYVRLFLSGQNTKWVVVIVILWIMHDQRNEQLPSVWVGKRIQGSINRTLSI